MASSFSEFGHHLSDISNELELQNAISSHINKIIIVFVYSQSSRTCELIRPDIVKISSELNFKLFFSINIEDCFTTALKYNIQSFPSFLLFFNKKFIEKVESSSIETLMDSIIRIRNKLITNGQLLDETNLPHIPGQALLTGFIDQRCCECLNDCFTHPFKNLLDTSDAYTESDCDQQLLISFGFNQSVRLHSLCFRTPQLDYGPQTVKLFLNLSNSVDFDWAERTKPIVELILKTRDFGITNVTALPYVKFQYVQNLTLFIQDNQGNKESTRLTYLGFFGSVNDSSSMEDFKRISGKLGENH